MNNIIDFGAIGDGITLNTKAIQEAINAGGMVYIPAGVFRTGTLQLKSNGGLHLAPGAVLLASEDNADYNDDDFCVQNCVFKEEHVTGGHLITAIEQENIVIEGHGTINGSGDFWMNESNVDADGDFIPNDNRPGQMLFICECKNVRISGINLTNGPYWHLFLHGCEDVFVSDLKICGAHTRWTNDGIDIDCCSRVTVSNCIIDVGDDALTIRAYGAPLKNKEAVCENVTVTNCVLHAHKDYGIRIGVGAGLIRKCTLSNMTIEAPNYSGIGMMSMWSPISRAATRIEDILMSNINITANSAFEIYTAPDGAVLPNDCFMRNVCFSHIMLEQQKTSRISGIQDVPVENMSFSDVTVIKSNLDDNAEPFAVSGSKNVTFRDVNIFNKQ
jgi:polygalacturonase